MDYQALCELHSTLMFNWLEADARATKAEKDLEQLNDRISGHQAYTIRLEKKLRELGVDPEELLANPPGES